MGLVSALRAVVSGLRRGVAVWAPLAGADYHHFRNLIIPTSRGTSEIDHLIVSQFGLFVVELKDRSGWVFADEKDPYWTAVHFKRKFRFQNPIHQNFGHMKALQEVLGIGLDKMHSVVVFRGRFRFMTPVPRGVLFDGYSSWVVAKKDVLFETHEVERILSVLKGVAVSGWGAASKHARSVRERYASMKVCPKCRGRLVKRVARAGPMPGSEFLGCSNFPSCEYIRGLDAT